MRNLFALIIGLMLSHASNAATCISFVNLDGNEAEYIRFPVATVSFDYSSGGLGLEFGSKKIEEIAGNFNVGIQNKGNVWDFESVYNSALLGLSNSNMLVKIEIGVRDYLIERDDDQIYLYEGNKGKLGALSTYVTVMNSDAEAASGCTYRRFKM